MSLIHHMIAIIALTTAVTNGVKLCVTPKIQPACETYSEDQASASINLVCVQGRDRYDCLHKIMKKEADLLPTQPEDVYLARELYGDEIQVIAESRDLKSKDEPWRYQGVAVVRKTKIKSVASLRGSKSCHTGYARNAGWNIPFSHLLEKGEIKMDCNQTRTVVEHDLRAISNYFGQACIPGDWVPDNATNIQLKEKYRSLCTICRNPGRCGRDDDHAGYKGALRCLVDSSGDVAWTKLSAVREFFKERTDVIADNYGLLCPDGRVENLDSTKPCHWAARPWNSWVARTTSTNKKEVVAVLSKVMALAVLTSQSGDVTLRPWANGLLRLSTPSVLHVRQPHVTPRDFLKELGYDTTIDRLGCPEVPVRLCVESDLAKEKCQALRNVLHARRIRPFLECVSPTSGGDCLSAVASGSAHVTTVDGGDVYRGHVEFGLFPVLSEVYGQLDASYFAVAVVKADSGITSLSQLKGKKSCHTGIEKTAGWKIPVVTLLEAGLLKAGNCDYAGEIGTFFSSSCAPGAKDPTYDPRGTNPKSLCELCVGTEVEGVSGPSYTTSNTQGQCERNSAEAFYGYTGAFRCLVEGGGDVAFVKHTTVGENTNDNNQAQWAKNLRALDFKLLCKKTGTADVVDYNACHLARVPAHKVLAGPHSNGTMLEEIRILFLRASEQLPKGQDIFTLFGPFQGRKDLIFKDSATELVNVREDEFHKTLGSSYYRALTELSACTPKESQQHYTMKESASTLHGPICFLYLLLCTTLIWLLSC